MACNNRGNIKRDPRDPAGAIVEFDGAIALKPDYSNAIAKPAGTPGGLAHAELARLPRAP